MEVHGQFHDLAVAFLQRTPSTHSIVDHVDPRADLGMIMEGQISNSVWNRTKAVQSTDVLLIIILGYVVMQMQFI
jgi:hypothetical protein